LDVRPGGEKKARLGDLGNTGEGGGSVERLGYNRFKRGEQSDFFMTQKRKVRILLRKEEKTKQEVYHRKGDKEGRTGSRRTEKKRNNKEKREIETKKKSLITAH